MEPNPYNSPESSYSQSQTEPTQRDRDFRMWAMFLHLSVLLGMTAVPLLGLVVPIVIWQVKKDEFPELDVHGRNVANWLISALIYGAISFLLCLVFIGFPLLVALWLVSIIFPLIAGLKANNGIVWDYPLSFRFV